MTDQIEGWRLTTPASITDGTKTSLGWAIRVADKAEATEIMSKALGGIRQFHAESLSAKDVADYELAKGDWKQL